MPDQPKSPDDPDNPKDPNKPDDTQKPDNSPVDDELNELYQEIILDHHRRPRNRGQLPVPPASTAEGYNPLCGDQLTVFVNLEGGKISDIKFNGQGCAISQSSASLMTQQVKGKTVAEARAAIAAIQNLLVGENLPPIAVQESLGDLIALPVADRDEHLEKMHLHRRGDMAHHAEVEQRNPPVIRDEHIAWVGIRVKEPVHEDLL